jgi:hypothetical protein
VRRTFIEELESWIETENLEELRQCEAILLKKIRDFAKIVRIMLDKQHHFWEDKMAVCCWKEYFVLWKLLKRADRLFKKHKQVWATRRPTEIKDED